MVYRKPPITVVDLSLNPQNDLKIKKLRFLSFVNIIKLVNGQNAQIMEMIWSISTCVYLSICILGFILWNRILSRSFCLQLHFQLLDVSERMILKA